MRSSSSIPTVAGRAQIRRNSRRQACGALCDGRGAPGRDIRQLSRRRDLAAAVDAGPLLGERGVERPLGERLFQQREVAQRLRERTVAVLLVVAVLRPRADAVAAPVSDPARAGRCARPRGRDAAATSASRPRTYGGMGEVAVLERDAHALVRRRDPRDRAHQAVLALLARTAQPSDEAVGGHADDRAAQEERLHVLQGLDERRRDRSPPRAWSRYARMTRGYVPPPNVLTYPSWREISASGSCAGSSRTR